MSICSSCGKELDEGTIFCPKCGWRVSHNMVNAASLTYSDNSVQKVPVMRRGVKIFAFITLSLLVILIIWAGSKNQKEHGSFFYNKNDSNRNVASSNSIPVNSVNCNGCAITNVDFTVSSESMIKYSLNIKNTKSSAETFGITFSFFDSSGNELGRSIISQRLNAAQELTLSDYVYITTSVSSSNVKSATISAHY
ncbi:MAG: zinc-ribbon domain-containing protein [Ruminococcus sp.]|nr:zinc-ribbon domain-containing protein [Ruminococcus sp.]